MKWRSSIPLLPVTVFVGLGILASKSLSLNLNIIVCLLVGIIGLGLFVSFILKKYHSIELSIFYLSLVFIGYLHFDVQKEFTTDDAALFQSTKKWCIEKINTSIIDPETQAFSIAIITGDREQLSFDQKQLFAKSGTYHLLAISGLHIGIIYSLFYFLLTLLPINVYARRIIPLIIVWGFTLMSGCAESTLRASIIISLFVVAYIQQRDVNSINILCASALIILIISPASLFSIGFQLSFAAYIGILWALNSYAKIHNKPHRIWNYIRLSIIFSISTMLTTLPFVLFYFHQLPLMGVVTNMIAIPITTLIIYLLIILLSLPAFISQLIGLSLSFLYHIVEQWNRLFIQHEFLLYTQYSGSFTTTLLLILSISLLLHLLSIGKSLFSRNGIALVAVIIVLITGSQNSVKHGIHIFNNPYGATLIYQYHDMYITLEGDINNNLKAKTYIQAESLLPMDERMRYIVEGELIVPSEIIGQWRKDRKISSLMATTVIIQDLNDFQNIDYTVDTDMICITTLFNRKRINLLNEGVFRGKIVDIYDSYCIRIE